jgi:shikimate dehydrogenase
MSPQPELEISGKTKVYALIADPISHVRAPQVLNAAFARDGIDAVVVPVHVAPQRLPAAVEMFRNWQNLVGVGVTIPHKEAMSELVDELTAAAVRCGATNVIRRTADGRLCGTQLDGPGFVGSLLEAGIEPRGQRVLLLGAGGTAKAIGYAMAERAVVRIEVVNRTAERARALATVLGKAFPDVEVVAATMPTASADLVVNATSLGMSAGDPLPVDPARLKPPMVVADVVMSPPVTPLLAAAAERGCVTHAGRLMLDAQVRQTLEFLGLKGSAVDVS